MTHRQQTGVSRVQRTMAGPNSRKIALTLISTFLLGLFLAAIVTCTAESANLGQWKKGRTLHFSVVSVQRTPELRYLTCDVLAGSSPPSCDPNGLERRWSISSSSPGMELVLVRAKVQNHTAVSAFINVDRTGAELRDFANGSYRPLLVNDNAWRDLRGEPEALVRMNQGQCFDGGRSLVDAGSTVRWQSESEEAQFLEFDNWTLGSTQGERAEIAPGGYLNSTFDEPGKYTYTCGDSEASDFPAELWVASPGAESEFIERRIQFLQGSFELLRGQGLDGYLVFEAPVGTVFRDIRWQAGDSIRFDF